MSRQRRAERILRFWFQRGRRQALSGKAIHYPAYTSPSPTAKLILRAITEGYLAGTRERECVASLVAELSVDRPKAEGSSTT